MDATDFRIYVALFPDRRLTMRGLDPRLSADAIGQRVNLPRATVEERLAAWERDGFLTGRHVLPNPALLGGRLEGLHLRVPLPEDRSALAEALADFPHAVGALEYVGDLTSLLVAVEDGEDFARVREAALRVPGVAEATPFPLFAMPRPGAAPTALDWRIVRALREDPSRSLDEVAQVVGANARTVRRRYEEMLAADVVWFFPTVDFRRLPGAVVRLNVWLGPGGRRRDVAAAVRRTFPGMLETAMSPGKMGEPILGFLHLESAAAVAEARAAALAIAGVGKVEVRNLVRTMVFPAWFERRLDAVAPRT